MENRWSWYKKFLWEIIALNCSSKMNACTSRTVPRPRTTTTTTTAAPTTTPRPNITFPTYKCPGDYAKWYCLNGATCFTVQIGVEVLFNCECKDGFMGPRCEYKELEGSYLASRPRVMLEKASIAGGAVAAIFLTFVVAFFAYVRWHQNKKRESLESGDLQQQNGHHSNGHHNIAADVVDGSQQLQYSSQLASSSLRNGDNIELQHPQQQQFIAVHHHHHQLRPFGPHHDEYTISMSDALLKR
ncbi:hypothetical protein PVAND_002566 [Polypedilum vanderplanki]|uniref:EGF-like domain-containing protein n=1 Tax=Polypedilum vanderplanki TaxID=319348 RepID=A0A9J6BSZ1_POLVA|nr:hypothetical protein PVAND_002566 [Polypedilum vanderplanki]